PRRAGQGQRHAVDAWLAAVLDAVAVRVVPDEVADGDHLVVAEVHGQVAAAGGQGAGGGARRAGVTVGGRGALPGRGGGVARGRGHGHGVGARRLGETVVPAGVGG